MSAPRQFQWHVTLSSLGSSRVVFAVCIFVCIRCRCPRTAYPSYPFECIVFAATRLLTMLLTCSGQGFYGSYLTYRSCCTYILPSCSPGRLGRFWTL